MARYTGPKNRICRKFGEPILGSGKNLDKNAFPPGQHGNSRKRKSASEYSIQLKEKQKAKYTYGVLEKQFRNTYLEAARLKGATGENLIKLLESRLDNAVYRLGMASTRPAARQMVSHKHVTVNGEIVNIPSYRLKAGDVIGLKPKSAANTDITSTLRTKNPKISWLDYNEKEMKGTYLAHPERENVPENIKEQLIVELYSK
ncbi:MAG: 30S ribosomal protein S4 [Sphingobacteriales bacterium]|nr:MAG: 30S ribosomal protein S4 [Sphingobacteriales bacterium]